MADLSLKYLLYGEDKTASSSIKGVGKQAESTGGLVAGGLHKLGDAVGGEVGDMINKVGDGLSQLGESGKGMGAKMAVGGVAVAGLGVAMQSMASKDVEAKKQLAAAAEATGKSYAGFGEDVDKLIEKQVAFGHSGVEVQTALQILTQAYKDPKKALAEMGVTTDLAAAKHINLADAAKLVGSAHNGAGKWLKGFGITIEKTTDSTKALTKAEKIVTTDSKDVVKAHQDHEKAIDRLHDAQKALSELEDRQHAKKKLTVSDQQQLAHAHDKVRDAENKVKTSAGDLKDVTKTLTDAQKLLKEATAKLTDAQKLNAAGVTNGDTAIAKLATTVKGQASASMDSFGGKVSQATTWLTDQASALSTKYGPAVTIAGGTITALGTVMEFLRGRQVAAAAATAALAAAQAAETTVTGVSTAAVVANNVAWYANPVTWVIAGIVLLVAAIYLIATKTTWFQTIWEYTWHAVEKIAGGVVTVVIGLFRAMLKSWTAVIGSIISIAATIAEKLHLPFAKGLRAISNSFNATAKAADDKLAGVAKSASTWGDKTGKNYAHGMSTNRSMVQTSAGRLASAAHDKLLFNSAPLGAAVARGFASGIQANTVLAVMAASSLAGQAQAAMAGAMAPPHRASGGPVVAGMPYWVGEHGPELFVPERGGGIIPNNAGSGPGSSGGAGSAGSLQPLLVQFILDNRVLHQSLLALKRTNGGGLALG